MNGVNKTLYIPLYGKAFVSRRGIILEDRKAEEIWAAESFTLKGKAASKWLAYYMGMRSAVFDRWLKQRMEENREASVIHIGCGMDSRVLRVGTGGHRWYDVDFPAVIEERRRYYAESDDYRMLAADVREGDWLRELSEGDCAIVLMEGVSMYMSQEELKALIAALGARFDKLCLLADFYTNLAAKMSKYKNPINAVGVTEVYGMDEPRTLCREGFEFLREHSMTPPELIDELSAGEKRIFSRLYAGSFAKKLYRLYEYEKT